MGLPFTCSVRGLLLVLLLLPVLVQLLLLLLVPLLVLGQLLGWELLQSFVLLEWAKLQVRV